MDGTITIIATGIWGFVLGIMLEKINKKLDTILEHVRVANREIFLLKYGNDTNKVTKD